MYRNVKQKIFHSVIITIIIIAILSVGGMLILRYQVEGESNITFKIIKIYIIESVRIIWKKPDFELYYLVTNNDFLRERYEKI